MKRFFVWMGWGCVFVSGYVFGRNQNHEPCLCPACETSQVQTDFTQIKFIKREGDQFFIDLTGSGRLVINEQQFFETPGEHRFSFAAIPNADDLVFRDFSYVGNTKTFKFYNADSYHARGTEVHHRRWFHTKEEAINEGFIPSKNMK